MAQPTDKVILKAFLSPALENLRRVTAQASLEKLDLALELPRGMVIVRIAIKGRLAGATYWCFEQSLARAVAEAALPEQAEEPAVVADAAAEFANLVVGNASGALLATGHPIEFAPPEMQSQSMQAFRAPGLARLRIASSAGRLQVIVDLKPAPPPPPPDA